MNPDKYSLKSRAASFRFAFKGISELFRNEPNAIIHLVAAVIVACAGIILDINRFEWCMIAIVAGIVFVAEIFNTAIENLGDAIDLQFNERIKKAKDLAARFKKNFAKYEGNEAGKALVSAGPQI